MPTFGDWKKAHSILRKAAKGEVRQAAQRALLQEAELLRAEIVQGIVSQAPGGKAFQPLSPLTIAGRQLAGFSGTKALIRSGALLGSVSVVKARGGYFVGVHRSATSAKTRGAGGRFVKGTKLVDIAALHEFGAGPFMVRKTPRMMRYLAVLFRRAGLPPPPPGSGGRNPYIVIKIPARPFIRPVVEKLRPGTMERFTRNLSRQLDGRLGRA